MESLHNLFTAIAGLVRRAVRSRVTVLLWAGADEWVYRALNGSFDVVRALGPTQDWDVALRGDAQVRRDHWQHVPSLDVADIFGMRCHRRLVIKANFFPLMRQLQVVKDVLARAAA
jgi:hypothetical protein